MFCNSPCGNKGFVFSLDALVAIFIVVVFLAGSFLLITKTNEENYQLLQQVKLSNDLFTALDLDGKLDSLNQNTISTNIKNILPSNFNYNFRLECKNKIIQINNSAGGVFVMGERIIVTNNLDFCIMRYSIWPK